MNKKNPHSQYDRITNIFIYLPNPFPDLEPHMSHRQAPRTKKYPWQIIYTSRTQKYQHIIKGQKGVDIK